MFATGDAQLPQVNPSSPVYSGLHPDSHARAHLILAEGEGAAAVIDLFNRADAAFTRSATLLYTGESPPLQLLSLRPNLFPDIPALLRESAESMEHAVMGTTIYLTGSASFISEAVNLAVRYGVSLASVMTEQRGATAKRVQCVHCKSIIADVVTATVACPACKTRLTVRDHYSRRLGAFMGVSCEAEQAH